MKYKLTGREAWDAYLPGEDPADITEEEIRGFIAGFGDPDWDHEQDEEVVELLMDFRGGEIAPAVHQHADRLTQSE